MAVCADRYAQMHLAGPQHLVAHVHEGVQQMHMGVQAPMEQLLPCGGWGVGILNSKDD